MASKIAFAIAAGTVRVEGSPAPVGFNSKMRRVALVGSDGVLDVLPSQVEGVMVPVHDLTLVSLGMNVMDNLDPEAAADMAAQLNRWDFMLTFAPLPVTGATGSPLNALADFLNVPFAAPECRNVERIGRKSRLCDQTTSGWILCQRQRAYIVGAFTPPQSVLSERCGSLRDVVGGEAGQAKQALRVIGLGSRSCAQRDGTTQI
ncbi:MAG: hypothetical protein ABW034_06585 [Steroidobacteraceae bacterium]